MKRIKITVVFLYLCSLSGENARAQCGEESVKEEIYVRNEEKLKINK